MKTSTLLLFILMLILAFVGYDQIFKKETDQPEDTVANLPAPIKNLDERKIGGPVRMYYDSGQLKAERTYKNAKLNGAYRMYYENGQLKVEGTYKDDKMDGIFRRYHQSGKLQAEEVYQDNILISRKVFE